MKTTRAVGVGVAFVLAITFILHGQVAVAAIPVETISGSATNAGILPDPGDDGNGGANSKKFNGSSYRLPDYGTNLWIAQLGIVSGNLAGIISNSIADVYFELQTKSNLLQSDWGSAGGVYGSELTNWTPFRVTLNNRQNLFVRALSWQDSTGTGIPDWWWLHFFGQITNVDAYADPDGDGWNNLQEFQNGTSPVAFNAPPTPTGVYAYVDSTGTNVLLSWNPASSTATNYVIYQGVIDWNTYGYVYHQIGQTSGNGTTFQVVGAIQTGDDNYKVYAVKAAYAGGGISPLSDYSYTYFSPPTYNYNIYLTANLVRNATGRWQVMFSGLSTNNVQIIQLSWIESSTGDTVSQNILASSLTDGIYQIPNMDAVSFLGDYLYVQPFGANGEPGQFFEVGVLPNDAPYFVDGRQHTKQNLTFLIRAASLYQPFGVFADSRMNQTSTNFEEFSFLYHDTVLDDLWPFKANYELFNFLLDPNTYDSFDPPNYQFTFVPDFNVSIPAPAVLNQADPYWIRQLDFNVNPWGTYLISSTNWGVILSNGGLTASLPSGLHNAFGLSEEAGCVIGGSAVRVIDPTTGLPLGITNGCNVLFPGSSVTVTNSVFNNYGVAGYASQYAAPTLSLTNYYFAPLINPYGDPMNLPSLSQQPFSLPIDDTFKVTNQTPPLIVGAVGQPMILGGWAKYSIKDGSTATGKYAYLGQYFVTNAFLLSSNGVPTTNHAGIVSPYGEFFPTQAGAAALLTMPDIDPPYQQGTGVVQIISINTDANHDGTLDFSYFGPDQTSSSRPFRFWVNDNQDAGDYGGNYGIPGQIASIADGYNHQESDGFFNPIYRVHGARDLVDFFPGYINIGSLFQSNALSAGISATDTNYQFVLSQADGVLRFAYTDLTPTNYLNFLHDTNEARLLGGYYYQIGNYFDAARLTTISNSGVALKASFVCGIATNNQGIILVEAAAPTTQPLVLSIYHGTNLIAQTSLYLSISGVEQMFRSKTMLLNPQPGTVPDRLNDWDVPNEPDTVAKNFVFLHGYNVLPNEARGVAADMFKRMYWSGSHAKFWAVTWEGADSKLGSIFTPNYHSNVVNALNTAPLLANFVASLTNSGPVVAAAHSLGNMLTLSAISDWHAPISQYFMMDAAVPIEAIDPASTNVSFMTFSTWAGYSNRLFAADWYQLFPTNDARSTLSWNNRLGNLGSVDVYNFYSSGEEVLRLTAGDPPLSTINILVTQLINRFSLVGLWPDVPFGTYTWYWQEKGKGTCNEDRLIGSSHGGWKFSSYWVDSHGNPLSPAIMNNTTNSILQSQPMFNFNSTANSQLLDIDNELLGAVHGIDPSAYAAANRNRILSDAIPAMSLVAGANPVTILNQPGQPHNFDMMTRENGWAAGRPQQQVGIPAAGEWHHSDFVQMAYTFTYKLFNQFVSTGNLK